MFASYQPLASLCARYVTPKQAAEAAGITMDRLYADLGDMVERTPKERTLKIK